MTASLRVIDAFRRSGRNALRVLGASGQLGYGVPPPFPTWGAMLSGTGRAFMLQSPWLSIWPGLAISAAVFGFNMLGDALRDVLDPRLRGR